MITQRDPSRAWWIGGAATALLFAAGCQASRFHGASLDPPPPAPEPMISGADGGEFRLGDHKGRVIVLTFGYTSCPDVCPTTLSRLKGVHRRLGDDACVGFGDCCANACVVCGSCP